MAESIRGSRGRPAPDALSPDALSPDALSRAAVSGLITLRNVVQSPGPGRSAGHTPRRSRRRGTRGDPLDVRLGGVGRTGRPFDRRFGDHGGGLLETRWRGHCLPARPAGCGNSTISSLEGHGPEPVDDASGYAGRTPRCTWAQAFWAHAPNARWSRPGSSPGRRPVQRRRRRTTVAARAIGARVRTEDARPAARPRRPSLRCASCGWWTADRCCPRTVRRCRPRATGCGRCRRG